MNLRDALDRWDELHDADDYRVVALIHTDDSDDEFPFEVVDIVGIQPDSDDDTVNLVMAAEDDSTPTLTVREARFILRDLVGAFGESELYVREEIPDTDGHWVAFDAPVVASGVNAAEREFALMRWYEGCDRTDFDE